MEQVINRMPKGCSVRKSPYCNELVSMRIRGATYGELGAFLSRKGVEFAIPQSTLSRNLKPLETAELVPCATLIIEQWGGNRTIDLKKEVDDIIQVQKVRVDRLVRREERLVAAGRPDYVDRNVKEEMGALADLIKLRKTLDTEAISPETEKKEPVVVSQAAKDTLANLILGGELTVDPEWFGEQETTH